MLIKTIVYTLVLLIGGVVGWWSHIFLEERERPVSFVESVDKYSSKPRDHFADEDEAMAIIPKLRLNEQLIVSAQFVALIDLLKSTMLAHEQVELDQELLTYAAGLVENRQASEREQQLLILSNVESIKSQVLTLLVSLYQKNDQNQRAVAVLFQLRRLANFDDEYKTITQQIKRVAEKEVQSLIHANQKDKVVIFYEQMLALEPDNYELQMEYASFEYKNRHYDNALRLLNVLIYHPNLDEQALNLLQLTQRQLERQSGNELMVSLDKRGEQYLVNVMINHHEPVKLMIDTGASMTIVSPEVIRSLGIEEESALKWVRFSTANGIITAPVVNLDEVSILQYSLHDLQVGVLPSFPMGGVDGLLGMDFLSKFTFFIDQENTTLLLSRSIEH